MLVKRIVPVLTLAAVLSVPLAATAQETATVRGRSGFMMSGRLMTPWTPVGTWSSLGGGLAALPRFVLGAQLGNLGVGAGVNVYSWDDTVLSGFDFNDDLTIFMLGPTITYAVAKTSGGRGQLHLLGSFTFAMGSSGDVDITGIGFDFGVIGRAMLLDNLGLDVGATFDFLSVNWDPDRGDDETDRGIQIIGFIGATFIL